MRGGWARLELLGVLRGHTIRLGRFHPGLLVHAFKRSVAPVGYVIVYCFYRLVSDLFIHTYILMSDFLGGESYDRLYGFPSVMTCSGISCRHSSRVRNGSISGVKQRKRPTDAGISTPTKTGKSAARPASTSFFA